MPRAIKNDSHPYPIADGYSSATVLKWNDAASIAVTRIGGIQPMTESRIYAMVNVAMHDALNNIEKNYNTYALNGTLDATANPDAAVAQAAHDMMVALLPTQKPYADSLLNAGLALVPAGSSKDNGAALGKAAASAMITKRLDDGASAAQYPIVQGTQPGEYRSTPPFEASGLAVLPGWGKVKNFFTNHRCSVQARRTIPSQ